MDSFNRNNQILDGRSVRIRHRVTGILRRESGYQYSHGRILGRISYFCTDRLRDWRHTVAGTANTHQIPFFVAAATTAS